MNSLVKANQNGKLSQLENLDLSENCNLIESLDTVSSKWKSLKKLRIDYKSSKHSSTLRNGFKILCPLLEAGCLPIIKEMRITCVASFPVRLGCWKHLEKLDIVVSTSENILRELVNAVEIGDLPALQNICLLSCDDIFHADIFARLGQKGTDISVVDPYLEKIIINADLM